MKNALIILFFGIVFSVSAQDSDTLFHESDSTFLLSETVPDNHSIVKKYISDRQYTEAIHFVQNLENPDKELILQEAICYKSLNEYRKAVSILTDLNENFPEDTSIKFELIACYEYLIDFSKALAVADELLTLSPDNSHYKLLKANLLYKAELFTESLNLYKEIEDYNPAYLNKCIALCFENLSQSDSARYYFMKVTETDPEDILSNLNLVKSDIKNKLYIEALARSEVFLTRYPDHRKMKSLNAFAYYSLQQYEEAASRFENCLQQGDSSTTVIRALGISHYFLKNDSIAYDYLHTAYARDTTNTNVLYALAQVAYNLEFYPESIEHYHNLFKLIYVDKNVRYSYYKGIAEAYEKSGDYRNSVFSYKQTISNAGDRNKQIPLYLKVAQIYENNLGLIWEAIQYYNDYGTNLLSLQVELENQLEHGGDVDPKLIEEIRASYKEVNEHVLQLNSQLKEKK